MLRRGGIDYLNFGDVVLIIYLTKICVFDSNSVLSFLKCKLAEQATPEQ